MKWTAERCETLGRMIDDRASGDVIATHFGVRPTAIYSKARTFGWCVGQPRTPEQQADKPWERQRQPGVRRPIEGVRFLGITIDEATFNEIDAIARREGTNRTAAARLLIEWGLEAA